jgi:hypothetical protein
VDRALYAAKKIDPRNYTNQHETGATYSYCLAAIRLKIKIASRRLLRQSRTPCAENLPVLLRFGNNAYEYCINQGEPMPVGAQAQF